MISSLLYYKKGNHYMEIELGPLPKFEDIRSNAFWSRTHIDTRMRPDFDDADIYAAHLRDCNNNPTIGLLARRQYITKKPMNYPTYAMRNFAIIKNHPEVGELEKSLKNKIKTLYPRTKHIREYIINNDRVELDLVKPTKKYSFLNKIAIFCKRFV